MMMKILNLIFDSFLLVFQILNYHFSNHSISFFSGKNIFLIVRCNLVFQIQTSSAIKSNNANALFNPSMPLFGNSVSFLQIAHYTKRIINLK